MDIALIFAAVSAFGAAIAAFATYLTARETRKASEGTSLNRYLSEFSDVKMLRSLRRLRNWEDSHGTKFAEKWKKAFDSKEPEALQIDLDRRHVSHYFQRALHLYHSGYVSKRFVEAVLLFGGRDILYEIVEPLEYALSAEYNRKDFQELREICPPSPPIGRLKRPAPIP
jgi:hypothetical protein